MKAFVSRIMPDGKTRLGMTTNTVTGEYKTLRGLLRYGIPEEWKALPLIVEVYYGDNVYKEPDKVIRLNCEGYEGEVGFG